ncbi:hypothetical protein ACFZAT_19005 [Streptomyces sp. NPDC008163]|uniref:hypothetical protein n=1 Tax=Streptomyces sp. NPDC008163 TaxID=3364818 RepID=UPI0036E284E8
MAAGTVKAVVALTQRRARKRATDVAHAGAAAIPCRISWPAENGRKAFVYGKLHISGGTVLFGRRSARLIELPAGGTVESEPSWRAGNSLLSYRSREGETIRILAGTVDAETISRALTEQAADG